MEIIPAVGELIVDMDKNGANKSSVFKIKKNLLKRGENGMISFWMFYYF